MDSTMMWIVHNAMNKAHAKMKSKGGVLERLNGISRFYELAAMQLEGCLTFVRKETSYILESSDEQVLSDLSEIRDRLQLRLKESEMAIKDKDRELASLRANPNKPVRSKSDPLEEYMVSNRVSQEDGGGDSEICELKNSVDQQVWHIRQQLEPEYKSKEGNAEVLEGLNNKKIEHLDSDIGVLKETLDLAFGKMQKAIFGSEVRPVEQQWQEAVERHTMSLLIEGFMKDFREHVEEQVCKKQEKRVCFGLKGYWSDLMNEVENLRRDLEPLTLQNEVPKSKTSHEKSSADDSDHGKLETQQSSKGEGLMQEGHEEEKREEEGHLVSKMIKNHESIIQKKSAEAEELNTLKREILRHKANLSGRREEDTFVKRRMQEVMMRVEKLKDWDAKLQVSFINYDKFAHGEDTPSEKRSPKSDATFSENLELDTLSEVWEKMDKVPYGVQGEQQNEGRMLKQEQDESNLKDFIMKEIYVTVLESVVKEICIGLYDNDLENLLWRDICLVLFTELMNQWKENSESNNIESQTREELNCTIHCTVLSEAFKDYGSSINSALAEAQNLRDENNLKAAIREDIVMILYRETTKEWTKWKADYEIAWVLKEELDQLVFHETIKDIVDTASYDLAQHQDIVARNFLQSAESLVKEDLQMVFIRQTIEQWNMELNAFDIESLIREDIYDFVIVEAVKDAFVLLREDADPGNQDKFSKAILFVHKLHDCRQVSSTDENVNDKIESLFSLTEVEENMVQSESFKMKGYNADLDSVSLECESSHLGSSVGIMLSDSKKGYNQTSTEVGYTKLDYCQPIVYEKVLINSSDSMFTPFLQLSEEMVTFQHTTNEKLEMNFLRYCSINKYSQGFDYDPKMTNQTALIFFDRMDNMKHHVDNLAVPVSSLRKQELLYKEAFRRRCHDLWKAETEVDLLGDQVDCLLGLLEKIYTILYSHSPVLQQYSEVSDILELIKKKLVGVFNASKD
ncbi:WPP domain-associated protein [Argentina anserina]|uniref:WPP domain-associated protein n=1 Tax=Argentina anserina TaxID=57926 RepID=UPI0021769398|nr:WPP domain-associated protein [Potentilla anserina]